MPINILVGSNGVGKSNFIKFFQLLNRIYERRLQVFVGKSGYADRILYFGRKTSKFLSGEIIFKNHKGKPTNSYDFNLAPDQRDQLVFVGERGGYKSSWDYDYMDLPSEGQPESGLMNHGASRFNYLREYFEQFMVFHFHDTSSASALKQPATVNDNDYLREDGSNLAAFLFLISQKQPATFKLIEHTIRSVAPFFERFDLKPDNLNPKVIFLRWIENSSDDYFDAHNFSDGTIRFIALTTLLLQPNLPKTIIIDEPELGLHPYAIGKLAAMIKSASNRSQIIVSTQSVTLLDQFEAKDIIVVDREDNQTVFKRQNQEELAQWIEDYSMGQIWGKNLIGGTP